MVDWKPGDVAECIDDSPCYGCGNIPMFKCGGRYLVATVCNCPGQHLVLVGFPKRPGHPGAFAKRFRKITLPDDPIRVVETAEA